MAFVAHSLPAQGIRVVAIALAEDDQPVDLRWWYGDMEAPSTCMTISSGSSARVVLVEDLVGKCGVYVSLGGTTNKMVLDIPMPSADAPRCLSVVQHVPSREELEAGPQEVIRIEWIDSDDPAETDKRVQFIAFELANHTE